ncbi:MAG TPA: hypothetical protein VGD58_14815 [Herpetosiphonaceae bacterium]
MASLEIKVDRTAYRAFFSLVLIPFVVIVVYSAIFRTSELGTKTFLDALLVGVGFAVYHEIAQFIHQLGHVLAAQATGYPMTGIRYEWVFTYSEYPPDEPPLPAKVHIQRSLGGVGGATLVLLIGVLLWMQAGGAANGLTGWLLNFLLFDSLLLFIASAVLSDGVLFVLQKGWLPARRDA